MKRSFESIWIEKPLRSVVVLTVVAAALRLPFVLRPPADVDETWSWYFIELLREGRGLQETFLVGLDGPLYVGLQLAIASCTEDWLSGLRIASALFGFLAVPLAWDVFRRFGSPRFGLLAAALTTFSPFLIYYSMQARPYALLLLGCLLFARAAAAPSRERSVRGRAAVAGAALLAVSAHYYAIVFLGTWYAVRAGASLVDRRWRDARAEAIEGTLVLIALTPLLALLLRRLSSLGVGYWQADGLGLPAILTDMGFLAGATLGDTGVAWLGAALILLPFAVVAWRRPRVLIEEPWLLIGPSMPMLAGLAGFALGRDLLFYPRAYIGAVPFLLVACVRLLPEALPGAVWRWLYAGALILPFAVSAGLVSTGSSRHPHFADREILEEIVDGIASFDADYDLVLVHHWFLAQFVAYHHPEPQRVRGLGMFSRNAASYLGEIHALVTELDALPPDARLLLVRNALASQGSDPEGAIVHALRSRRPLLTEQPCRVAPLPGEEVLCDRLYLFGPERAGARER